MQWLSDLLRMLQGSQVRGQRGPLTRLTRPREPLQPARAPPTGRALAIREGPKLTTCVDFGPSRQNARPALVPSSSCASIPGFCHHPRPPLCALTLWWECPKIDNSCRFRALPYTPALSCSCRTVPGCPNSMTMKPEDASTGRPLGSRQGHGRVTGGLRECYERVTRALREGYGEVTAG